MPLNLLVDSTGIKLLGEGDGQARKHVLQGRRQCRKVHLAMEPATSDICAVEFAERLKSTEETSDVQRQMLEAAARRPHFCDEVADWLHGGRF